MGVLQKMSRSFSPFVYWAQSNSEVSLRIDLKDVKEPDVTIEEDEIEFACVGTGGQGLQKYEDWWPRLLYEQKKCPWLKIDFDRIKNESDSEAEEEVEKDKPEFSYEEILKSKYPDAYEKLQAEELGFLNTNWKTTYLFCYNLFMFCGFLYVFIQLSRKYMEQQEEFLPKAFATVGDMFKFL